MAKTAQLISIPMDYFETMRQKAKTLDELIRMLQENDWEFTGIESDIRTLLKWDENYGTQETTRRNNKT